MSDLDFIPSSYHATLSHRRRRRSQMVWTVAMIAVMVLWIWMHRVTLCEAQDQLDQTRSQWADLGESRRCLDALVVERDQLARRGEVMADLNDSASMIIVLAEISGFQPQGSMLTELLFDALEPRKSAAQPAPIAGIAPPPGAAAPAWRPVRPRLRLVGVALNNVYISELTTKLGGSPLFRDVNTQVIKDAMIGNHHVRQFEVECALLPHKNGPK